MNARPVAVVLAAGESRRMGFPKALLPAGRGKTFLGRLVRTFEAAGCEVVVVVGRHAQAMRSQLPYLEYARNRLWRRGQFSSAKVGLRAALALGATSILIHPVDVPLVRSHTARRLLRALKGTDAGAVVPVLGQRPGHPLALDPKAARGILRSRAPHLRKALAALELTRLPTNDRGVVLEFDTPVAYRRHFGRRRAAPRNRRDRTSTIGHETRVGALGLDARRLHGRGRAVGRTLARSRGRRSTAREAVDLAGRFDGPARR